MHYTTLVQAVYYAPRGGQRLMHLGMLIAQRYLRAEDRLIGVVGDAGAGKSLLIRGMFPGLVLTNDDDGVNVRPLPVLEDAESDHFRTHTYHLDVRFEMAFSPLWKLAEAVKKAVSGGHRVVVEHFELLYPLLNLNAEVLIGVGEEVVVTVPTLFGPFPTEIAQQAFDSIIYRKMAHSAEDITSVVMKEMGFEVPTIHSDVKHGFVLEFTEKPKIDLVEVGGGGSTSAGLPISYLTTISCRGQAGIKWFRHILHDGWIEISVWKEFSIHPLQRHIFRGRIGNRRAMAVMVPRAAILSLSSNSGIPQRRNYRFCARTGEAWAVVMQKTISPDLPGCSAGRLKVLKEVRRHWRGDELPVIALAPPERGEVLLQEAASLGADYCMQRPVDYAVLARRIKQLCRENVPRFAADLSRQRVEDICRRYFDAMGIPPHYKGYRYLMEGVWLACQHPRWLNAVTTRLYPAIGKRFATGGVQVERAMRYALDATWEKGELDELYRLFPYEVRPDSGKPTNSAFLAKMVNFVLLEIDVGG